MFISNDGNQRKLASHIDKTRLKNMTARWQSIQLKIEIFKCFEPNKCVLNPKKVIKLEIKAQNQKIKVKKTKNRN